MEKRAKVIKNVILTVLMMAVGVFFSLQLRSIRQEKDRLEKSLDVQIETYSRRLSQLEDEIAKEQQAYDAYNQSYQDLLEDLAESDSSFYEILKTYHENIEDMKESACLTDVSGPGVEITLNDSAAAGQAFNSSYIVHDTTILSVVNQLKLAGAKAISVNDERIVPMSEFICVGPAVKINDTKVYAPFVIKAVGDSALMKSSIESSNVMTNPNINVSIKLEVKNDVTIPSYNKAYRNNIDQLKDFVG